MSARPAAGAGGAGDVGTHGRAERSTPFYKLTGSGNDFVFFDERAPGGAEALAGFRTPAAIEALCDRRNGVGADGVVFLKAADGREVRIAYYNRDGSRAALCGNATLCTARLAAVLGLIEGPSAAFVVATDAGRIEARVPPTGDPVIALGPVRDVAVAAASVVAEPGELAVGYALAGVPHLVVLVADVADVALDRRGAELRAPNAARPDGANVNWVSRAADGRWRMRTFERGVEGETLACGTGAVAAATLIARWTAAAGRVVLITSSGRPVEVTPAADDQHALLAGEGRLVFEGQLRDAS